MKTCYRIIALLTLAPASVEGQKLPRQAAAPSAVAGSPTNSFPRLPARFKNALQVRGTNSSLTLGGNFTKRNSGTRSIAERGPNHNIVKVSSWTTNSSGKGVLAGNVYRQLA